MQFLRFFHCISTFIVVAGAHVYLFLNSYATYTKQFHFLLSVVSTESSWSPTGPLKRHAFIKLVHLSPPPQVLPSALLLWKLRRSSVKVLEFLSLSFLSWNYPEFSLLTTWDGLQKSIQKKLLFLKYPSLPLLPRNSYVPPGCIFWLN